MEKETIDLTPTWEQWLHTVMAVALRVEDPAKVLEPLTEDFKTMARLADIGKEKVMDDEQRSFEAIALNLQQGLIRANLPGTVCNAVAAIYSRHKNVLVITPEWRDDEEAIKTACPLSGFEVFYGESFHIDTWDKKIEEY